MREIVIKVEDLSKQYQLGVWGTGTLSHDINRWWHKVRGREDPYLKIGETNIQSSKDKSGYVWALRDVNFEVEKGEVLGIIGKNGAGKSTLLKLLSKVTGPTTGQIKAKGRIASLLEVGTGFHPELTGRENIYLNGTLLGMTKSEVNFKLEEIIDFAGVERYLDTPIKRYSSGMKVRLGFAVAAHLEPEILIVDEVLAVGDAEFQKKAIGKMQEVSRGGGRTVLFVSHNMLSIENLCSRSILLENGGVVFDGDTNLAISRYLEDKTINNDHLFNQDTERKGSGEVKFRSWNLKMDNKIINSVISGASVTMEFDYEAIKSMSNVTFSIAFFSEKGLYFTACNSEVTGVLYNVTEGVNCAKLLFNKLPFSSGRYFFNITIRNSSGIIDWIENAGYIDVVPGDYYKSGKLPASNRQGVLIDYQWN